MDPESSARETANQSTASEPGELLPEVAEPETTHPQDEMKILREKLEKTEAVVEKLGTQLEELRTVLDEMLQLALNPPIEKLLDSSEMFPRCFMDIETEETRLLGCIVIKLRKDVAPNAANLFLALCAGDGAFGYDRCDFNFKRSIARDGTVVNHLGYIAGNDRICGERVPADQNGLQNVGLGVVSMKKIGPKECNGAFNIVLTADGAFDCVGFESVVFGAVVEGMDVLSQLKSLINETNVKIRGCGLDQ